MSFSLWTVGSILNMQVVFKSVSMGDGVCMTIYHDSKYKHIRVGDWSPLSLSDFLGDPTFVCCLAIGVSQCDVPSPW